MTRRQKIVSVVAAAALVLLAVVDVISGRWPNLILVVALVTVNAGRVVRPVISVDSEGIHRPWRRRRLLGWAEVDSIASPTPGVFAVRLNLVGGKTLDLAEISSQQSTAVAALGGKSLARLPRVKVSRVRPGGRPGAEPVFDIDQRIRQLDSQRAVLAADARQLGLRPHPEHAGEVDNPT